MTPPQDNVSDVERLLRDLATYLPSIRVFLTSKQRPHEAGLQWHDDLTARVAAAADRPAADRDRVAWALIHALTDDNIREVKQYGNAGPIADAVIAALAVPINKIGEDARTYADGVEDAAKVVDAAWEASAQRVASGGGMPSRDRAELADALRCAIRRLSTSTDKGVTHVAR